MKEFITVVISETKGSAPRDVGASMRVWRDGQDGTIGGGALEWEAARIARKMLADNREDVRQVVPLGPDLGQCCGGSVTLDFSREAHDITYTQPPLWIWGAGHVGRATAGMIAPLQDRAVTLVDTAPERMPPTLPDSIAPLVAADPVRVVSHAQADADHLILTYSHDLDLALCDALLRREFRSVGLIGSATKWTRFRKRLSSMGHGAEQIARIVCPIGDPGLGKHPQAIAVGVVAALISASAGTAKGERTG